MSAIEQIQLSKFDFTEFVEPGLGAVIPRYPGRLKLPGLPLKMRYRAIYFYLEAIASIVGSDFELVGELELKRDGVTLHSIPCSLANNPGGLATVSQTRFTAFPSVAAGTEEGLFAVLTQPLAAGAFSTTLTPQRVEMEFDELWFSVLGSALSAGTFAGWRALMAVRSSTVPL